MIKNFSVFLILCIFIFLGFGLNGCGKKTPPEPGRYYNKNYSFSIKFPKEWELYKSQELDDAVVEVTSPWENDSDMFSEFIAIYVDEVSLGTSLEEYFNELNQNSENELAHYQEEDSGTITIENTIAKWIIFSYTVAEGPLQSVSYLIVKDHRAYIIFCNTEPDKFEMYRSKFEKTAQSLKFE